MAYWCIDPVGGDDGIGSSQATQAAAEATPFKSWSAVTFITDDIYLQKRGTIVSEENGLFINFNYVFNVAIGNYGDPLLPDPIMEAYEELTISADWTQPDAGSYPNVWQYNGDTLETWNAKVHLGSGTLGTGGVKVNFVTGDNPDVLTWTNAPSAEGEWDTTNGYTGLPRKFYLYSVGNPIDIYGSVYLAGINKPVSTMARIGSFLTDNIHFRNTSAGIKIDYTFTPIVDDSVHIANCKYENNHKGIGIAATGTYILQEVLIENNVFNNINTTAIGGRGDIKSTVIRNNHINTTGFSESFGGIYYNGMAADSIIDIYDNELTRCETGNFYADDGAAIEFDYVGGAGVYNAKAHRNIIYDCGAGFHDNSGTGPIQVDCNLITNSGWGISTSDSTAQNSSEIHAYNNTIVDCGYDHELNKGNTKPDLIRVDGGNLAKAFIRNNIMVGKDNTLSAGIAIKQAMYDSGLTVSSNNNYFNLLKEKYILNGADVSSEIAAEVSFVADPLFIDAANGNYNLQQSSPCVGVGTKWWNLDPRPESLSGEPLPDVKIDLGAYQSTWDANHPANL